MFNFPWTNLHQLNLDWFLTEFSKIKDEKQDKLTAGKNIEISDDNVISATVEDAVESVNGKTGEVVLSATDINTSSGTTVEEAIASAGAVKTVNGLTGDVVISADNTYMRSPSYTVYQAIQDRQPTLVSGSNIKTVNNVSLLGSGNVQISGTGAVDSVNGMTGSVVLSASDINTASGETVEAALQKTAPVDSVNGKTGTVVLTAADITTTDGNAQTDITDIKTSISSLTAENITYDGSTTYSENTVGSALNGKQDTLVSGTSIKTVNGNSLLGSGNIEIQGGGSKEWTALGLLTEDSLQIEVDLSNYHELAISGSLTSSSGSTRIQLSTMSEIFTLTGNYFSSGVNYDVLFTELGHSIGSIAQRSSSAVATNVDFGGIHGVSLQDIKYVGISGSTLTSAAFAVYAR